MTNIPTDLLRTLVAVVDLRSYTKAANSLGVTQPAVSAQIKRLQQLIGADLFERNGQGVGLTPRGDRVVARARRLLSLNDEIVGLGAMALRSDLIVRIGTPSDFVASVLPAILGRFREAQPDVRFVVRADDYDPLLRQLHMGEIDVLFGLSPMRPHDARHCEAQEMVWLCGDDVPELEPGRPVPLVSCGEPCVYHRHAVKTLRAAGLDYEQVFLGPTMRSLGNAVAAGMGYAVFDAPARQCRWPDRVGERAAAQACAPAQRHLCPGRRCARDLRADRRPGRHDHPRSARRPGAGLWGLQPSPDGEFRRVRLRFGGAADRRDRAFPRHDDPPATVLR